MATKLESKTRRGEGDYSYSIVLAERFLWAGGF